MPWLKTDDREWLDPWVMHVGPTAYGAYQRLMGYCAQNLTDGVVPAEIAAMVFASATAADEHAVEKLLAAGRVAQLPSGSWSMPFYLDENPSRERWLAEQQTRKTKAKKAADARWKTAT